MRQRALDLFNEKVEEQKTFHEIDSDRSNSTKLFLEMVPKLTNIVKDKEMVGRFSFSSLLCFLLPFPLLTALASPQSEDMALTKQTALLSLDILSRNFAANHSSHFLGAPFEVIIAAVRHSNPCVQGSALVCLATLCLQLGPKMVTEHML